MSRRLVAEALGTGLLLFVIVGSGIQAATLGDDGATNLLAHSLIVGLGLAVLVLMFQPVSGSHFNPAVTLALWRERVVGTAVAVGYVLAQLVGAVLGVMVANLTFAEPAVSLAGTARDGIGLVIAEGVGTLILVLAILVLVRSDRASAIPVAVGAWVAAIVFATASTGFANPAVTVARMLTDTYTGIAPSSVLPYLGVQVLAGLLAVPLAALLSPDPTRRPVPA